MPDGVSMFQWLAPFECLRRLTSLNGFAVSWFLRPLSLSKGGFAVSEFEWPRKKSQRNKNPSCFKKYFIILWRFKFIQQWR